MELLKTRANTPLFRSLLQDNATEQLKRPGKGSRDSSARQRGGSLTLPAMLMQSGISGSAIYADTNRVMTLDDAQKCAEARIATPLCGGRGIQS